MFALPAGQFLMMPFAGKLVTRFGSGKVLLIALPVYTICLNNVGLTMVENRKTTVNGSRAIVALSKHVSTDQSTGQQSSIMVLSYFIEYNDAFYVFHGLSAETGFGTFAKLMETSMTNFSKLTDPIKLNVKPKRIMIKTVQRSGTFDEALKSFGVPQKEMPEVALLNNSELKDKVQAGKLVKIISNEAVPNKRGSLWH